MRVVILVTVFLMAAVLGLFCTAPLKYVSKCLASFDGNGGYCARTRLGAGCFDVLLNNATRSTLCLD